VSLGQRSMFALAWAVRTAPFRSTFEEVSALMLWSRSGQPSPCPSRVCSASAPRGTSGPAHHFSALVLAHRPPDPSRCGQGLIDATSDVMVLGVQVSQPLAKPFTTVCPIHQLRLGACALCQCECLCPLLSQLGRRCQTLALDFTSCCFYQVMWSTSPASQGSKTCDPSITKGFFRSLAADQRCYADLGA